MKKPPLFLLPLVLSAVLASPVWAEKADRNKDMIFDADRIRIDDVKQVTNVDGNVVMTKGTILVRAAHIVVRQDASGYQSSIMTGTPDKPAFFRQKREAVDEFIEAESERIDYDGTADIVKFTGKAKLRRFRGAVLADEISGAVIVYENLTDKFSVDGTPSAGPAGTPVPGSGRVRAILTPKPESAASAAASSVAKPPASQPSPSLRSTTTLGSPPQ
jgi:lipopolysaccharide export system protein LptA